MDISKKDAKVCVRVAGAGRRKTVETVTTWSSMTSQILALREHLIDQQVTCVVMEATGDYWKPFYYLLEDAGFEVMLVNARHVKTLPGRKTDVADATWLAQLGAHGLVRGSFVPPEPIRQLRDLTRARTAITRERGREVQRLEKLLEDLPGVEVMLVNARHVKTLPGRKTDVADATWLAQLGAHGLVRGSFVPPEPIRQLRDLTRARTAITRERGREVQRLEKLLEDAGIKLSAVASDILGVSGRLMLEALIVGDRDPAALADLAKRRLRSKIPQLTEALRGRFTEHHAFLARVHLDLIDRHTDALDQLTARSR